MRVLGVIIRKEFTQFFHSGFLPKLCVIFPLVVMMVMPLVANMEVRHVGVVMVDNDRSAFSRHLASSISASNYLDLAGYEADYNDALRMVEKGDADVIVSIPAGFYASLSTPIPMDLDVAANSVNATKGAMGMRYVQAVIATQLSKEMSKGRRGVSAPKVNAATLYLFNPTLNYRHFMIPAITIMLIVMLCGFLPALNIVSEKETGTIEQINVSPISQLAFTFGKVVPYWIIGFVVLAIAMVVAWLVYGLVPRGNIGAIYLAAFLFIVVMSSMGVIIANNSTSMQQVMFVMFFFVMVFILMSGLMTPISSMPQWAQNITYAIPPRYFIDIMRGTYLRGATIADQWLSFTLLGVIAAAFTAVAITSYRKQA